MGHLFGEVSNSEREMQALLKQKESELRQTTSELEERSKLLLKAKVTIEQLSQELSSSRQEEHTTREDLHSAEDKLHQLEEQLSSRATTAKELQVLLLLLSLTTRLHVSGWLVAASQLLVTDHLASRPPPPLQAKLQQAEAASERLQHQQHLDSSSLQAQLRERDRRLAGAKEELDAAREQAAQMERLLRERKDKVGQAG